MYSSKVGLSVNLTIDNLEESGGNRMKRNNMTKIITVLFTASLMFPMTQVFGETSGTTETTESSETIGTTDTVETSATTEENEPKKVVKKTVSVMHTNDINNKVAFDSNKDNPSIGLAKLKTFKEKEKPTLLVDAGNSIYPSEQQSKEASDTNIKAMNLVGYDVMSVGWSDLASGLHKDSERQKKLAFPIVSTNITYKEKKEGPFKPYQLITKKVNNQDESFAILGLTYPTDEQMKEVDDLNFKEPMTAAVETIDAIGDKADYVVIMTHLTNKKVKTADLARDLKKEFPTKKIFIVDGDSTESKNKVTKENDILYSTTGKDFKNVGLMTATIEEETVNEIVKESIEQRADIHPYDELKNVSGDKDIVNIVDKIIEPEASESSSTDSDIEEPGVPKEPTDEVETAIDQLKKEIAVMNSLKEEDFTAHSFKPFSVALEEAKKGTDSEEHALFSLQELQDKEKGLVSIKELRETVEKVKNYQQNAYTPASFKPFEVARGEALTLLEEAKKVEKTITSEDVVRIKTKLDASIDGLIPAKNLTGSQGLLPKTGEAKAMYGLVGVAIIALVIVMIMKKKKKD